MKTIYFVCIIALSAMMMMATPAMAAQHAGWVSDSDIVSGLPDAYDYELGLDTAPTVFNMDGTWYLISGETNGEFYGFKWSGSRWESCRKITSGLPDISDESSPEVFCMNGTWYLISGERHGTFYGFRWSGHGWESDSAIASGLGDIGSYSKHTVFCMNGTWYLISGEDRGEFFGFRWSGSAWEPDSAIASGLGDVGYGSAPTVFNKDGAWYLISGNSWGKFHGFTWTCSAWQPDSAIVSGLGDVGSMATPDVFYKDGTWYLISGEQYAEFYGYHYQYPTTKPDLIPTSLQPTTVHLDQSNTLTATIRNDGGGNASSFNVSLKLGEALIGTKTVDALNIGEEKSIEFTWTPESPGTFNLTVTVDTENVIDEFDETNNAMIVMVTVERASTPFLVSGRVNYDNGDAASNLFVTVTNLATSDEFTVKTDASSNYYRALTDSRRVSVGDTIKINATDGTNFNETSHTVTTDEMNSGGFGEDLTLATAPDLTIMKIVLLRGVYVEEEHIISVTVENIGLANAESFDVTLEADGTLLSTQRIPSLDVGNSTELEFAWTPCEAGKYELTATADSTNEIAESDETNNRLTRKRVIITRMDWPQFHYDASSIGFSPSSAPSSDTVKWISEDIGAGGGLSWGGFSDMGPVVASGKVFTYCGGSGFGSTPYDVACLDEKTGELLWKVTLPYPMKYGSWAPLGYDDGMVFCTVNHYVVALDADDGGIVWECDLDSPDFEGHAWSVNSGPTIAEGKVFAGTYDAAGIGSAGGLAGYVAIDEYTGEKLWQTTGDGHCDSTPAYYDGVVYAGFDHDWTASPSGGCYALNASIGEEVWKTWLPFSIWGSVSVDEDYVYGANYNFYGPAQVFILYRNNGTVKVISESLRTDSTPAVAYDNIYICGGCEGFSETGTFCVDKETLDVIWNAPAGSWTASPAVADGKVYVGGYCYDAFTGAEIFNYTQGGLSPVIANGMLFNVQNGRVVCYGQEMIPANVRIEPEILNLNASGKFTAFITLPEGCDVANINVSTVKCEGASALNNGTIAAHDNGTLVVKFDRADLEGVPAGDAVTMTVTGELTDGRRFEGSDTVRVIAKGKGA